MRFLRLVAFVAVCSAAAGTSFAQPVQNAVNGHFYELVVPTAPLNWYTARDAAAARSFQSAPGHLATITTAQEQAFVRANFGDLGGGDLRGIWYGGYQD